MLFIDLPSGRRLCYVKPRMGINQFGSDSVTYEGTITGKWGRIESYGPKFVENIVQAVSRDIIAYAMKTLRHCFMVGHVHDELIIECSPSVSLDAVCEQMGMTPPFSVLHWQEMSIEIEACLKSSASLIKSSRSLSFGTE